MSPARPGHGPHVARAECSACGSFVKWLPKALFPGQPEEWRMVASLNRVVLLGVIGQMGSRSATPRLGPPRVIAS